MASDLARITVTIPEDLLAQLDELTARRGLAPNRSEAIRDLIREQVLEESVGEEERPKPREFSKGTRIIAFAFAVILILSVIFSFLANFMG